MAQLEVEDLRTYYYTQHGTVKAVDGVSFAVDGESLGIAGESGCGKTTLGLSLIKLVPPPGRIVSGAIRLDGEEILSIEDKRFRSEFRWKKISMIFQGAMNSLNPVYPIGNQLEEPLIYLTKTSRPERRARVREVIKEVGLAEDILARYPHELSGGMIQRIIIAMALLLEPSVVVADEPTTALDVVVQARIINLLKYLKQKTKASIILITHDLGVISEIADKVAIMYAGEMVEYGPAEQIYKAPKHPYTQKLLAAIPSLRGDKRHLESIPGAPPDLRAPPTGCRFHPRCPHAMDICSSKKPATAVFDRVHAVDCWLHVNAD